MDKTIACDISAARRDLGYEPRSTSTRGCGAASGGASSRASSCDAVRRRAATVARHRRIRVLRFTARAAPRRCGSRRARPRRERRGRQARIRRRGAG
jgi:hypothetical protein